MITWFSFALGTFCNGSVHPNPMGTVFFGTTHQVVYYILVRQLLYFTKSDGTYVCDSTLISYQRVFVISASSKSTSASESSSIFSVGSPLAPCKSGAVNSTMAIRFKLGVYRICFCLEQCPICTTKRCNIFGYPYPEHPESSWEIATACPSLVRPWPPAHLLFQQPFYLQTSSLALATLHVNLTNDL